MKRVLLIAGITVLVILSGLFLWLRFGVGQEKIQSILADALGPDYTVEINSARISPLQRAVSIGHMTISTSNDGHVIFRTDTLRITGINPGLIFRKNIILSKVKLDAFTIDWDPARLPDDEESGDDTSVEKLKIASLDITNGTIIVRKEGGESNRMNALNLKAGLAFEFKTDPDSLDIPQYSVDIDSLGFLFSEDRYRLSLSGFNFEHQDSLLTLSSMKLIPVGGYFQFMRSREFEANMFDIEIVNFTAAGIDPAAFHNKKTVKARSLDFDAFSIHVAKDKQLPEKPDKKDPTLLNKTIQNLPVAIQFDSLFFRNTNIQYSEQDEEGTRPGTISFMNSTIQITDVNSLSQLPASLNAVTYLQNHSELNTELHFSLHDGPFHMTGSGNLHPFDLKQLNSIFMDLEGMEVVSGFAHELEFYFEMTDDTSSGSMHLVYEDLKMEIIDMDDYDTSFTNSIKSFIANEAVLRADNLADSNDEVRTGEIDHVRNSDSSFFQHLWHSLRSGIYDIALRL
ncbi:hypothetical protein [Natronogracilivirga saccharolytica]|uniref:DUF748 domain-containing protein n=1 Tax=Natronogracilivirga saccharolytica TaxID=2812953 RepID=A0A8J7RM98_9BACT|nr:hypothetical protein [Natronogracilivirga saccharolytica]MBP3193987.1 hypothetical protein [Natronogracilivirga saccharolytica]